MSGQRLNKFLCLPPPPLTPTQTLLPGTYPFSSEKSVTTSSLEVQTAEIFLQCSAFCSCLNCKIFTSCENLRSSQKDFPSLPITYQNTLYAFAVLTNVFSTMGNVLAFPEYFKLLFPQCEIQSHPKCNMWFLGCSSYNGRNGEAHV